METTEQIFKENNKKLKRNLIPKKSLPIYGTSEIDINDEIFSKSFKQIQDEALNKCVNECLTSSN